MGYPAFQRARAFKFANRTAGDLTVSSTTYVAADTALDLALEAQVGDVLQCGVNALWSTDAQQGRMDAATMVSGAAVNYLSGTGANGLGMAGWIGQPSVQAPIGGPMMYVLTAGDLAAGLVTVRLMVKVGTGTKLLYANTGVPLQFWIRNLGPQDPH